MVAAHNNAPHFDSRKGKAIAAMAIHSPLEEGDDRYWKRGKTRKLMKRREKKAF